jgi:hypothetical protein
VAVVIDDEDADLRADLAALGPGALAELRRVLQGSPDYRDSVLVALIARPEHTDLAALIAMADTNEATRPRLLRPVRALTCSDAPK